LLCRSPTLPSNPRNLREAFKCWYQTITDFQESEQRTSPFYQFEAPFPVYHQPVVFYERIVSFPFTPVIGVFTPTIGVTSENHHEGSQFLRVDTRHEQLGFNSSTGWSNNQGTIPEQFASLCNAFDDTIFVNESHGSSLDLSDYQPADEQIQQSVPSFDTIQNIDLSLGNLQPLNPTLAIQPDSISQASIPNYDTLITSTVALDLVEGFIQPPSSDHDLRRFVH